MEITGFHIYGFGRIENLKIDRLSRFQVIYGQNESGKTTIRAFLHAVLFGFPTKQSQQLRYEPRGNVIWGGMIYLNTELGLVSIERIAGNKAEGEVKVILDDGTVQGNHFLAELTNGLDRETYEQIFSFDIHGLQTLHQLKEEQIGRFLFSAGMTGTDLIFQLENHLQKEMDLFFKKGGRKPVINLLLQQLKNEEKEWKKSSDSNDQYQNLIKKIDDIKQQYLMINQELETTELKWKQSNDILKKWHFLNERKMIEKSLEDENIIELPRKGIRRIEQFHETINRQKAELESIEFYIEELRKKVEGLVQLKIAEEKKNIATGLIGQWDRINHQLKEFESLSYSVEQRKKDIHLLKGELMLEVDQTEWMNIPTGIATKMKVKNVMNQHIEIQAKQRELERMIKHEGQGKAQSDAMITDIEKKLWDEEKYHTLTQAISNENQTSKTTIEKEWTEREIGFESERLNKLRIDSAKSSRISILAICLFVGLLIGGFLLKDPLVSILSPLWLFILIVHRNAKKRVKDQHDILSKLKKKLDELNQRPNKSVEWAINLKDLEEQKLLRQEWKHWILKLEEIDMRLFSLKSQLESVNKDQSIKELKMNEIKSSLFLSADWKIDMFDDALERIKKIQEKIAKNEEEIERLAQLKHSLDHFDQHLKSFKEELQTSGSKREEIIQSLKNRLIEEEKKSLQTEEVLNRIEEKQFEYDKKKRYLLELEKEKEALLKAVLADDEEEFYQKYATLERQVKDQQRLQFLKSELGQELEDLSVLPSKMMLEQEGEILRSKIRELKKKLDSSREQIVELQYEKNRLEEGGTHGEKLHQFYQSKSEFNEIANEWSKLAIAKFGLKKTIDRFYKERLPKVVEEAESLFEQITGKEYKKIVMDGQEPLRFERKDGRQFEAKELSQATKEQAYIALRLALVQALKNDFQVPLMIDDGFVHFDKNRTDNMMNILNKYTNNQILFFTCQEHLLSYFHEDQIVQLD
jgi:uncharacterized protein YhaN